MLIFEAINELTLKVTCTGNDVLFAKAGAFIAGDNSGKKNYRWDRSAISGRPSWDSLQEEPPVKTFHS